MADMEIVDIIKLFNRTHRCSKCGGYVNPGKDGMIRGLSNSPDGDPNGLILDTVDAIHYKEFCNKPDISSPFPTLEASES